MVKLSSWCYNSYLLLSTGKSFWFPPRNECISQAWNYRHLLLPIPDSSWVCCLCFLFKFLSCVSSDSVFSFFHDLYFSPPSLFSFMAFSSCSSSSVCLPNHLFAIFFLPLSSHHLLTSLCTYRGVFLKSGGWEGE